MRWLPRWKYLLLIVSSHLSLCLQAGCYQLSVQIRPHRTLSKWAHMAGLISWISSFFPPPPQTKTPSPRVWRKERHNLLLFWKKKCVCRSLRSVQKYESRLFANENRAFYYLHIVPATWQNGVWRSSYFGVVCNSGVVLLGQQQSNAWAPSSKWRHCFCGVEDKLLRITTMTAAKRRNECKTVLFGNYRPGTHNSFCTKTFILF